MLRRWWRRLRRVKRVGRATFVASTGEVPGLTPGQLAVVGPADGPKWALIGCPCRCGETLWVNLMPGTGRRWRLDVGADRAVTLAPSLDVTTCGSHFWVRRGRIDWV